MGKALIIKDADFSANAIETIDLSGTRHLTVADAWGEFKGSITNAGENGIFLAPSSEENAPIWKFININENEILRIPRQAKNFYVAFFEKMSEIPSSSTSYATPAFTNIHVVDTHSFGVGHGMGIKGDKEYTIAVVTQCNIGGYSYDWPDDLIATQEYTPTRELTQTNYDSDCGNKYLNASGSFGNDTAPTDGGPVGVFFNVYQGESVHIEAQTEKRCTYALVSQNVQPTETGISKAFVEPGQTATVSVTQIGLKLYIYRQSGDTNVFPTVLSTSLTE